MQQFFLFCTMLITATQAFSKQSHGRQMYRSMKRKSSESEPNVIPKPFTFHDLNVPMIFMPFAFEAEEDFEPSFFVAVPRFSLKPKRQKNVSFQREKIFRNRKALRRKLLKKRTLDVLHSAQCFKNGDFPHVPVQPHSNFTRFPGSVSSSRKIMFRKPNQYVLYLYPVFNHLRKRTNNFLKRQKFFNLKKQYLTNLRNKNKRSASSGNKKTLSKQTLSNRKENRNINEIKKLNTPKSFQSSSDQNFQKTSLLKKSGSGMNKNYDENLYVQSPGFEYQYNFGNDFADNLQLQEKNNYEPFPFVSTTAWYASYEDVTLPSISLPEVSFKYPYDPKFYESRLRNDDNLELNLVKKGLASERISEQIEPGTLETTTAAASPRDFGKLKQMLEEVESLLKGRSDDNVAFIAEKETKNKKKKEIDEEKEKEKEEKRESRNDTVSLKQKIDTQVIPLLTQISQDLGKMGGNLSSTSTSSAGGKSDMSESASKKSSQRCSPDGTWTSSVLGVEMTFTTMPNLMLKVKITPTVNPIINNRWAIQGLTLSRRGGPLMLAAIYPQKRKIASFIGQCKMCNDQDLIFGSWTIYTCVRRFTDLWKTVETKLDVLRKKSIAVDKKEKKKRKNSQEEKSKKGG